MKLYDNDIEERIENVSNIKVNTNEVPQWNRLTNDEYDADFIEEYSKKISDDSIKDVDALNAQDEYVNMELGVPRGPDGELENVKVKKRALDVDGMPIGKANKNHMLDTRAYEVEYGDGTIEIMYTNAIVECILSQVDDEGHRELLFEDIIDHRPSAGSVVNGPRDVKDEYGHRGLGFMHPMEERSNLLFRPQG